MPRDSIYQTPGQINEEAKLTNSEGEKKTCIAKKRDLNMYRKRGRETIHYSTRTNQIERFFLPQKLKAKAKQIRIN